MYRFITSMLVVFTLLAGTGCHKTIPPSVVTPQGQTAYQLEDLVDAVNMLQHEAIAATHAGLVPRATTLKIGEYRKIAVTAIDKAIDAGSGKAAALAATKSGLDSLEAAFTAGEKTQLARYVALIRTVLLALT
jgi:hypothetical protein